jgi:DNA polymerase IV (DinB-like DNA polymerase)
MHIDLDAFFAAVEQREHPEWKGRPVVVGADPKQGRGRGVVSTCSYEARKFGIKSAMPISIAYRLCPTAIFVRPDFQLYSSASDGVMKILRNYSEKFEQVGIDEAFIDVTSKFGSYRRNEIEQFAAAIKSEIREKEKLSCSIGVASNKLVAKIASDFRKPDGLTTVDEGREKEFLEKLPVRKLIGVGEKTEAVLKEKGLETVGELAAFPPEALHREFGKYGIYLHEAANGRDESEVYESYQIKSITRNTTFEQDTKEAGIIFAAIDEMLEDSCKALIENNLRCRTIGIRIRFEDFETHTREKTLNEPTTDLDVMNSVANKLLEQFLADNRKIRLVGVRLARLDEADKKQRTMKDFIPQNAESYQLQHFR